MNLDEFYEQLDYWLWHCLDNNIESGGIIDQLYANYYGYVNDFEEEE